MSETIEQLPIEPTNEPIPSNEPEPVVNPIGQVAIEPPEPLMLHPFLEAITREGDPLGLVTRFEFNSLVQFVQGLYNEAHPPATVAPVNVDVPFMMQDGDQLTCTKGNWQNEPVSYKYQWMRDGEAVGSDFSHFILGEDDLGKTFTCVVTATNAIGSTEAPPSNEVIAS